ncbi:response regulator [Sphingobium lactosutens]|uniref:Hisitidine kinase n=2 Tax=Sphingobium TaxID=165695 RepID=T0H361_9SPHN|nr:response regulator [Sphingobium lactosutens]EQB10796.1 hisitidine kinase [Sphingobium lactosutens DS20]
MVDPAPPVRPRICVVDDDAAVRRASLLALEACGYEVRAHSSPIQALRDPAVGDALCLVTEFLMQGMDGIALVRGLRATGWSRPAILVTAYRADYLAAANGEAIFVDILEKPAIERRLIASVDRATGRA